MLPVETLSSPVSRELPVSTCLAPEESPAADAARFRDVTAAAADRSSPEPDAEASPPLEEDPPSPLAAVVVLALRVPGAPMGCFAPPEGALPLPALVTMLEELEE